MTPGPFDRHNRRQIARDRRRAYERALRSAWGMFWPVALVLFLIFAAAHIAPKAIGQTVHDHIKQEIER